LRTLTTRILVSLFVAFVAHAASAFDGPRRMLTEEQTAAAVSRQVARVASAGESIGESAVRWDGKTVANGLTFSGTFGYERTGSTVILRMARIDNDSSTRTTGTLRLELWASSSRPAEGAGFTGYRLATSSTLSPLAPRTFYTDVVRTTSFSEPPAGTYWMVMVLAEFSSACSQSDGYCLTDSGIFNTQQTFGSAPPPPPSGNVTIISRAGNQCYENIPREVYDFLNQLLPGTFELHPSTRTCSSLGMPFFAGLLVADTTIRVYTTDAATAQILCSTGVIVSCTSAPPPPPPPPPSGNVTIISRVGNQCYENIPREVYDFLARIIPGALELHPSTTTCASLGMPLFAGLLVADTTIRVYTTDAATAQILCSSGVIVSCTSAPPPPSNTNYSDLWWNANESGWGVSITHHTSGVAFVAWYTYDTSGNPKWYVASECRISNGACSGALYETNGPRFDQPFNPAMMQVRNVGTISLSFSSANSGTMSFNVQGRTGVKAITRQQF
jgi:hypothetical protein